MSVEDILRDTLRDQAAQQASAEPTFADRVLRARRRRQRRFATATAAVTTAFALAIAVPLFDLGFGTESALPASAHGGISAHPDQSPPRDMIAAGKATLAAYYTQSPEGSDDKGRKRRIARTYWLLNPHTRKYEKDDRWSFVSVAPGLKTAAVLERNLPTSRIGLLDLATKKVDRWLPVKVGVGAVAYSHDGRRLVATTYARDPDELDGGKSMAANSDERPAARTGFHMLDLSTGKSAWSPAPAASGPNWSSRMDFAFTTDDVHVYSVMYGDASVKLRFYDSAGNGAGPSYTAYPQEDARNRLLAREIAISAVDYSISPDSVEGSGAEPLVGRTGERLPPGQMPNTKVLAWVDKTRVIAWRKKNNTLAERLVVAGVEGKEIVQLSGPRVDKHYWYPVFVTA